MAEEFVRKVKAPAPAAAFAEVLALDQEIRSAIFALTDSAYIELIFQINHTFAEDNFVGDQSADGSAEHAEFVNAWRDARLMELAAIIDGDEQLAAMAEQHVRNLWQRRFWGAEQDRAVKAREAAQA